MMFTQVGLTIIHISLYVTCPPFPIEMCVLVPLHVPEHTDTQTHLGIAYDMGFHDGSHLVLVIRAGQPALPFSWQRAQSCVCGPQHGERLVDVHREDRE